MPIYEYRCRSCGEEFDELVRMSTPNEEVSCPRCGEHQASRRMSTFATTVVGGLSTGSSSGSGSCGGGSGFS